MSSCHTTGRHWLFRFEFKCVPLAIRSVQSVKLMCSWTHRSCLLIIELLCISLKWPRPDEGLQFHVAAPSYVIWSKQWLRRSQSHLQVVSNKYTKRSGGDKPSAHRRHRRHQRRGRYVWGHVARRQLLSCSYFPGGSTRSYAPNRPLAFSSLLNSNRLTTYAYAFAMRRRRRPAWQQGHCLCRW